MTPEQMGVLMLLLAQGIACIIMAFIAVKLGLRMFLFSLISLACLFLMVTLCLNFTSPFARIVSPWIDEVVSKPAIVIVICSTILYIGLKITKSVEGILINLSDAGNRALGGALAATLTIIVCQLLLRG